MDELTLVKITDCYPLIGAASFFIPIPTSAQLCAIAHYHGVSSTNCEIDTNTSICKTSICVCVPYHILSVFSPGAAKVPTNQLPGAHSLSLRRGSDGEMNLAMSSSARSANGDDSFADGERPAVNLAMRQQSTPDVILSWFFASDYRSDCDASASHQRLRVFAPFSISIVESLNRTNIKGLPAIPSNHIFRHRH